MPQLRHRVGVYEQHHHDSHGHEEQREAEHGVQLADELVDGQKRGSHVVDEDEDDPEEARHAVGGYLGQQVGRVIDEHGSYEYHQQQGEDAHGELDTSTELAAHDLGQRGSAHAQRHHARHEVVDGSGEDGAENYPQERRRSVHDAHDGAEDGPQTGNVEKLYEENLPGGELDVVYAVGHGLDGRIAGGVYADHLGGKLAVNEIACYEQCQGYEKSYHFRSVVGTHPGASERESELLSVVDALGCVPTLRRGVLLIAKVFKEFVAPGEETCAEQVDVGLGVGYGRAHGGGAVAVSEGLA